MVVITFNGLHLQESEPHWNDAMFAIARDGMSSDEKSIQSLLEIELIEATA